MNDFISLRLLLNSLFLTLNKHIIVISTILKDKFPHVMKTVDIKKYIS
jgi:hypothetical protein